MSHVARNGDPIDRRNILDGFGLSLVLILEASIDALLFFFQLAQDGLSGGDKFIFALIGLLELCFVAGGIFVILDRELGYDWDFDAFVVPFVEALGGDSGEVFAVYILGEETVDVAGVTWNVLSLELVAGSADPGDSVLDVVVVRDLLCCVHLQLYYL